MKRMSSDATKPAFGSDEWWAKHEKQVLFILACGLVMLVLLFIDLFTKMFAAYPGEDGYIQSSWFLGIVRLHCFYPNTGIAYGVGANSPVGMAIITVVTGLLIIGIAAIYFTLFKKNTPVRVCLMVIEAGAIGNFIDRVCLGYVRDFIDVNNIWFIRGYICNVADIYIVFGAIALVFCILFIGPRAVWPLTRKWREEAKRIEQEKENGKKA